ncbi:unnamed protein product, partial [Oppiella nova]
CGDYHTIVLTSNGQVFGWGYNNHGQVGSGNKSIQLDPTPVEISTEYQISKIECNLNTSLALTCEGQVLIWGEGSCRNKIRTPYLLEIEINIQTALPISWLYTYLLSNHETHDKLNNSISFEKSFDVINKLGEGGYGLVYKVRDKCNHEFYAIKKCHLNGLTEKEKENVLNETQSLMKLRSEFVIKYYYSWIECNFLYFQMDLCIDNLNNVLETKKSLSNELMTSFEFYISYEMFRRLTECVQYLHKKHIIHRDLKPDNVLISMDYKIKLCDFGLAKEVDSIDWYRMSKAKHTADVGTINYMAPEAETEDYNHLTDIYSLSLIGAQLFDLKPDNVLISKYGEIKLCDFGLAKEVPNCDPFLMSKAKNTADVGTVAYMAPEAQTTEYNHLIDIYSLSLIGAQIFGFNRNDIIDGNSNFDIYNISLLSKVHSPKYLEALSEYVAKNEYNSWIETNEIFIQMKLCSDNEIKLIGNDLDQLEW